MSLFQTESLERYSMEPWQYEDIDYMCDRPYSANWSEMGTYKTSTGLWLMDKVVREVQKVDRPHCLIITSKGGKGTYFDAMPKCLPEWTLYNVETQRVQEYAIENLWDVDPSEALEPHRFRPPIAVLTHYDVFSRKTDMRNRLLRNRWNFIITDEAHRLKNEKTTWRQFMMRLKATYRHVMTGTGFVNNPAEMWGLLNWLDKARWPGYWNFRETYCQEYINNAGYREIIGIKPWMVDEFRELRQELGPRRMMAEVHKGIDHPIESFREVELNKTQRRMFAEIKAYLSTLDQQGETLRSPNVLSQLNRLRQICVATPKVVGRGFNQTTQKPWTEIELEEPSSKLDQVMDILEEIDPDKLCVVFSNFKDPLKLLEKRLEKKEISYLHMEQKHSDADRYRMWHDIFPQRQHRVFMSTLSLGGESINLTPAQYLIMLDRSWSPKDMMQAIGRVYRPGQTEVPNIIYIDANRTTDQYVKTKLDTKAGWFQEIFGED